MEPSFVIHVGISAPSITIFKVLSSMSLPFLALITNVNVFVIFTSKGSN